MKRQLGDAPLALVALQARAGGLRAGRVHRVLGADLLLVPTQRDPEQARAEGLNADTLWSDANLRRLHSPHAGEGEQLLSRWPLPLGDRVTPLHRTSKGRAQTVFMGCNREVSSICWMKCSPTVRAPQVGPNAPL